MLQWWLVPVLALVAYFIQAFFHAGSRALVGIALGFKLSYFNPWPHFLKHKIIKHRPVICWKGRVAWSNPNNLKLDDDEKGVLILAPYITGIFFWVFLASLTLMISFKHWNTIPALVLWGAATFDMLGVLQPFWRRRDGTINTGARALGINRPRRMIYAASMAVPMASVFFLGAWLVLSKQFA